MLSHLNSISPELFFLLFFVENVKPVSFVQFVCAIWHFLSLKDERIGEVGFMLVDPTGLRKIGCE